ncbi:MAG: sn-glycerol-3-phosphate ABC transporter permease UgpA [Pseudomonadota bacterium]
MQRRSTFKTSWLPYALILPQIIITLIFFIWPAGEALWQSMFRGDAFGLHEKFVWFANFIELFNNPYYLQSFAVTVIFSILVAVIALSAALFMAVLINRVIKNGPYKSLVIWPYAVAPAIAGVLWRFLFDPAVGVVAYVLQQFGIHWNYLLNGKQALFLVIIAASWQQFSYNFIFFLAGLQAIPKSLIEAAALDGAGPMARFWSIVFPLLSPTTFFLLVMNIIFAFFGTFGVIQTVTQGGPAGATNILVYKVYYDGFYGLNLGGSATQSVILLLIVVSLTVIQFRYIERKVHY